jgi:hypothetical protein
MMMLRARQRRERAARFACCSKDDTHDQRGPTTLQCVMGEQIYTPETSSHRSNKPHAYTFLTPNENSGFLYSTCTHNQHAHFGFFEFFASFKNISLTTITPFHAHTFLRQFFCSTHSSTITGRSTNRTRLFQHFVLVFFGLWRQTILRQQIFGA